MSNAPIASTGLGPVSFDLRGLAPDQIESVADILKDIKGATDRIARAARKWVDLPEDVRARVMDGTPKTLQSIWQRLDRIGNGALHPLLYSTYGHAANLLGKLPIDQQEKYLTEKIPVAVSRPDGRADNQRIAVEDMGPQVRLQVFKVSGPAVAVRSLAEQRAWLVEQQRKREAKENAHTGTTRIERKHRWVVEKGRVFIDPAKLDAGLTAADIKQIQRDLQASIA